MFGERDDRGGHGQLDGASGRVGRRNARLPATTDGTVTLTSPDQREAAHLTFSLSRGLVRDFGPVVRVLARVMANQGHDVPMGAR